MRRLIQVLLLGALVLGLGGCVYYPGGPYYGGGYGYAPYYGPPVVGGVFIGGGGGHFHRDWH